MTKQPLKATADAGVHHDHVYDNVLQPWRAWLRNLLLPLIRAETPRIAALQKRYRTSLLDIYFLWTANLGTHTFFMIFLPNLVWFVDMRLGRSIISVAAMGVFWSGMLKDLFCLPRPLSPPVHRLTLSQSASQEYGFPSTHTTNSVSVALYFIALAYEVFPPSSMALTVALVSTYIYAGSMIIGRIYCGMHSLTDVVGGALLAYAIYWVQWTFREQFDAMFVGSFYPILYTIFICLALVGIHPDPIERCPCFEDSVCFVGVVVGFFPGSWACERMEGCLLGVTGSGLEPWKFMSIAIILAKIILGVAILFTWRIACKKTCYLVLPPIYRAFNLPHRKYEIGARSYKNLHDRSIHPVPSVLDFHGLSTSVTKSEHVGIESAIDLHERRALERRQPRRKEPSTPPSPDVKSVLKLENSPLRYDVDIVTKLIVYSGIGFLSAYLIPSLFHVLFGDSRFI